MSDVSFAVRIKYIVRIFIDCLSHSVLRMTRFPENFEQENEIVAKLHRKLVRAIALPPRRGTHLFLIVYAYRCNILSSLCNVLL